MQTTERMDPALPRSEDCEDIPISESRTVAQHVHHRPSTEARREVTRADAQALRKVRRHEISRPSNQADRILGHIECRRPVLRVLTSAPARPVAGPLATAAGENSSRVNEDPRRTRHQHARMHAWCKPATMGGDANAEIHACSAHSSSPAAVRPLAIAAARRARVQKHPTASDLRLQIL